MGRGVRSPADYIGGLGERHELPQQRPGTALAAIAFSAYFRPQNASGSKKVLRNLELLEKLQIPL